VADSGTLTMSDMELERVESRQPGECNCSFNCSTACTTGKYGQVREYLLHIREQEGKIKTRTELGAYMNQQDIS